MELDLTNIAPGRLLEIYGNEGDLSKYNVGFIRAANDEEIVIRTIDKYGNEDGNLTMHTDSIIRINYDTPYLRLIEYLMANPVKPRPADDSPTGGNEFTGSLILTELQRALREGDSVCCWIGEGEGAASVDGFVTDLQDAWATIQEIDPNGRGDGIATIRIDMVSSVARGRSDERILQAYYLAHKNAKD